MDEYAQPKEGELAIQLEGDTEGHAITAFVAPEDEERVRDLLGGERGERVRIRLEKTDEDDVEGHAQSPDVTVIVAGDDWDTEGHTISLRFPTAADADAFRKRLIITGVLAGTIVLGGAAGLAVSQVADTSSSASGAAGAATSVTEVRQGPSAESFLAPAAGAPAASESAANRDIGIMDASGAAAASTFDATNAERGTLEREGGSAAEAAAAFDASTLDRGTLEREGGSAAGASTFDASDLNRATLEREGGGAATTDASTFATREREGGGAAGASGYEGSTFAQEREGGSAAAATTGDADRDIGIMDRSSGASSEGASDEPDRGPTTPEIR